MPVHPHPLTAPVEPYKETLTIGAWLWNRFDVVEALSRKNQGRRLGNPAAPTTTATATSRKPRAANVSPRTATSVPDPAPAPAPAPAAAPEMHSTMPMPPLVNRPVNENSALVDDGLVDFFRHGIHSQSWTLFDKPSNARMCYIGTSLSNISHLVRSEPSVDASVLHYPIPQIHHIVSWTPGLLSPDIRSYSVITQDLTSLPPPDIQDALVDAFFNEINPGFPVVDESEFRLSYQDKAFPPPLLLFQAVLLAGAHACQHPTIVESRSHVRAALFQRAKTLWDLRFENDRVTLVQAALLFSWHADSVDTVSANSYYWVSVASGIAFGLGMHRDPAQASSTTMPQPTRNLFRRIWWTLFQSAVFTALEHGRPLLCQPNETDQPPLTEADLVEVDGLVNKNIQLQYCVHSTALCHIVADIINMHSPGAVRKDGLLGRSAIDARMAAWFMALPQGNDCYMLQLRLHYNTALLHLHREATQMGALPEPVYSTKICGSAVDSIVNLFASIIRAGTIRRCYITALTAVMATAIYTTRELHLAVEQHLTLLALQWQSQLEGLFPIMRELAQYWPTCNAVLKLFQHILERSRTTMLSQSGDPADLDPVLGADDIYPPLDWDVILSTLHPNNSQHPEYDWSNVLSRTTN